MIKNKYTPPAIEICKGSCDLGDWEYTSSIDTKQIFEDGMKQIVDDTHKRMQEANNERELFMYEKFKERLAEMGIPFNGREW